MNNNKASKEWDRREYDEWLSKIEDSSLSKLLDEELWKLEPDRGDEAVPLFKKLILSHVTTLRMATMMSRQNWSLSFGQQNANLLNQETRL